MAAQLVHQLSGQYDFLNCSAYSWHTWTGNGQYVFVGATLPGHQIVGGQDLRSMYADDIAETVLAFYDSTFMKDYEWVRVYLASPADSLQESPLDTLKREYQVKDLAQLKRMRKPVNSFYEALRDRQFENISATLSDRVFPEKVKDAWVGIFSDSDTAFGHISGLTHMGYELRLQDSIPIITFSEAMWTDSAVNVFFKFTVDSSCLITAFDVK